MNSMKGSSVYIDGTELTVTCAHGRSRPTYNTPSPYQSVGPWARASKQERTQGPKLASLRITAIVGRPKTKATPLRLPQNHTASASTSTQRRSERAAQYSPPLARLHAPFLDPRRSGGAPPSLRTPKALFLFFLCGSTLTTVQERGNGIAVFVMRGSIRPSPKTLKCHTDRRRLHPMPECGSEQLAIIRRLAGSRDKHDGGIRRVGSGRRCPPRCLDSGRWCECRVGNGLR